MLKDKESKLHEMIERADEMIPKKKGVLDPHNAWGKKPSEKIIGEDGPVISNKYLKRFKTLVGKE